MAKPLDKHFKGISYRVFQEQNPNVYKIVIGNLRSPAATIHMTGKNKIDKIARQVINQVKKYSADGVISKTEAVKIDRFVRDLLVKEGVAVKTLTPITNIKDIKPGCVIVPRDVDIVATEDILIIRKIENNKDCFCIQLKDAGRGNTGTLAEEKLPITDIASGYLIVEFLGEDVKYYNDYKRQIDVMESHFIQSIKSICTDINNTSDVMDNHIEDYISNAILESNYNGLLKEKMIAYIEENTK